MKKIILSFAAALVTSLTFAQDWALDKAHSHVGFTIVHLKISEVDGTFGKFDAKMTSSKDDFSDAVFDFSAETASVNTGNDRRDNHLRSDDFFGAEKNPAITFKSTSVTKVSGNNYKITGNLTMKGVTKPITLDAVFRGPIEGRGGKKIVGIKASGTLNRIDFGVGTSGPTVDDEVTLKISGEFSK
ncbi:YceI family protein [Leadbetterella sp. DM7]|uniref:YceI family protein n=1 Tax=Leadbetterella sp. DM7 TaxID=3235085 RepID=UPI00349EBCC1